MRIPAATILKFFVDRVDEFGAFEAMLHHPERRILCVVGEGGIGKSLLVSRMLHECDLRSIRFVHIEWEDSRRYNYLDLMRNIRDCTDAALFDLFNDRVNFYTVPQYKLVVDLQGGSISNVQVLAGGRIEHSGVTVHVGHNVNITDMHINAPQPTIREAEVCIETTRAFLPCLRAVTDHQPLVIFFDAIEKADDITVKWIWDELLSEVRDDGLGNLFVVLSGRNPVVLLPAFFGCAEVFERPLRKSLYQARDSPCWPPR